MLFFFFFRYAGFSPHQGHLARPCCRLSAMPKKSAKAKKPEPVRPRNQPSIAQSMLGAKRKEPHDPPSDSESDPSRQVVDLSVDESAEPAADESVSSSDARVQPSWFREFPWILYTSGLVEPYFSYSALVYVSHFFVHFRTSCEARPFHLQPHPRRGSVSSVLEDLRASGALHSSPTLTARSIRMQSCSTLHLQSPTRSSCSNSSNSLLRS